MSLSISTGANSLVTLGLSLGDIALIFKHGRNFGNWFRATRNEGELLEALMEGHDVLLKRHGLVEKARMNSLWSRIDFVWEGKHIDTAAEKVKIEELSNLSWLMVTVVAALDACMPPAGVVMLLIQIFVEVLEGDKDTEDSLRVQLPTNVESWRSVASVRGIAQSVAHALQRSRSKFARGESIPQLNGAEQKEVRALVVWLMEGKTHNFKALSATVFGIANAMQLAGILLKTDAHQTYDRIYETEPIVRYVDYDVEGKYSEDRKAQLKVEDFSSIHLSILDVPLGMPGGMQSRAQLITYPRGRPSAMIDAIPAEEAVINRMALLWQLGVKAAKGMRLQARADLPFSSASEIYYEVEGNDPESRRYKPHLSLLALHAFPRATQGVLSGLQELAFDMTTNQIEWLSQHTELDFLLQTERSQVSNNAGEMGIWLQYQAMVFGFYYAFLEPLVSLEYVRTDVFFRGVWGYGSTTSLAACSQFGQNLRSAHKSVNRTHLLHMLAMMYGGRFKLYSEQKAVKGLQAVMGPISVTTLPLLKTTDQPEDIARFAIVETPVVDLLPDKDGEIYAGTDCDVLVGFRYPNAPSRTISVREPGYKWSLHAKMGALFGEGHSEVVMAARCNGRTVGWFSPMAADVTFLSSCYQVPRHSSDPTYTYASTLRNCFEVTDEQWQSGWVARPMAAMNESSCWGVVHSRHCPALRYAAAGMYASIGVDVGIATDDLDVAAGRVELDGGIVIA